MTQNIMPPREVAKAVRAMIEVRGTMVELKADDPVPVFQRAKVDNPLTFDSMVKFHRADIPELAKHCKASVATQKFNDAMRNDLRGPSISGHGAQRCTCGEFIPKNGHCKVCFDDWAHDDAELSRAQCLAIANDAISEREDGWRPSLFR